MNPEEVQCIEACQFPGTPNQANSRPRNKAFQNPVHMTYLVSHSSPKLSLNQVARAVPTASYTRDHGVQELSERSINLPAICGARRVSSKSKEQSKTAVVNSQLVINLTSR